jgi:hypothetical protein
MKSFATGFHTISVIFSDAHQIAHKISLINAFLGGNLCCFMLNGHSLGEAEEESEESQVELQNLRLYQF